MHLKPWYTLREYAYLTGENFETVKKQATRGKLKTIKKGGRRVVTLSHLQESAPEMWASIVLRLQVMAAGGEGHRGTGRDRDGYHR